MLNEINALPAQVTNSSTMLTPIFTTTNYSMFGHIGGNRNLDTSNLNKINFMYQITINQLTIF